jgi:hypothetical protein
MHADGPRTRALAWHEKNEGIAFAPQTILFVLIPERPKSNQFLHCASRFSLSCRIYSPEIYPLWRRDWRRCHRRGELVSDSIRGDRGTSCAGFTDSACTWTCAVGIVSSAGKVACRKRAAQIRPWFAAITFRGKGPAKSRNAGAGLTAIVIGPVALTISRRTGHWLATVIVAARA